MAAFLFRRLVVSLLLLLLVLSLTFVVLHSSPGDPSSLLADPRTPPAQRQELRHLWGLDLPLWQQYLNWLDRAALHGDWGTSFLYRRPAGRVLLDALPYTLLLGVAALVVQLVVAVPLGIWSARRGGTRGDALLQTAAITGYSIPTFWLALMALLLLGHRWQLFPSGGTASLDATGMGPAARSLDLLHHLALPALVLGLSAAGGWLRLVRSGMLEALSQPHLLAARARGLPAGRWLWLHGLRNAAGPLLQIFGLTLPALLSGALVVEVIFAWPGLGRVAYAAMVARDYPVILAVTAWSAGLVIAGSLLADLLLAAADPRIRDAA